MTCSEFFYYLLWLLVTAYFGMTFVLFAVLSRRRRQVPKLQAFPSVTVLVAARNEEANILRCLEALAALDYPQDKLQILIGDDDSDDRTAALVSDFARQHPCIQLVSITPSAQQNLKGKTNVLAQLFRQASGEYVFITDADIAVNPDWIRGLLYGMQQEKAAAASGTTFVQTYRRFHVFQTLEWMEAIGFLFTADRLGLRVTAVGNNMAIRRDAYEAVGGYEAIPFSVTEDLDLFLALKKNGYEHRMVQSPEALVWSQPLDSFKALFGQRKRWLKGVERTPLLCQFYLGMHSVFGLFIAALCAYSFTLGLTVYFLSFLMHLVRIQLMVRNTGIQPRKDWWLYLLVFDFYQTLFNTGLLIYFILPTGVEWKKRRYA